MVSGNWTTWGCGSMEAAWASTSPARARFAATSPFLGRNWAMARRRVGMFTIKLALAPAAGNVLGEECGVRGLGPPPPAPRTLPQPAPYGVSLINAPLHPAPDVRRHRPRRAATSASAT